MSSLPLTPVHDPLSSPYSFPFVVQETDKKKITCSISTWWSACTFLPSLRPPPPPQENLSSPILGGGWFHNTHTHIHTHTKAAVANSFDKKKIEIRSLFSSFFSSTACSYRVCTAMPLFTSLLRWLLKHFLFLKFHSNTELHSFSTSSTPFSLIIIWRN